MARKIILFGSLVFVGLTAGAAYVVWFDYNPYGMSAALYIAKMQHAIRVLTIPLPTIVVLGLLFTVVASFQARRNRAVFYMLVAASVCVLAVGLITRFGNIPINNQILTWSLDTPPGNWAAVAQKWWQLQTARLILQIAALCLVSSAVLVRTNQVAT
jgi:anthrone oxygenase-like protein